MEILNGNEFKNGKDEMKMEMSCDCGER